MKTNKNTCIVLNRVPKADFENIVLKSILFHEKPGTWKNGDPLAKNKSEEVELKWLFGPAFLDVVVQADTNTSQTNWAKKQGCKVKAVKTNETPPTWQVFHMADVI